MRKIGRTYGACRPPFPIPALWWQSFARQLGLNRSVALEPISDGALAAPGAVKHEAEGAASLTHPHIVPIYIVTTVFFSPYGRWLATSSEQRLDKIPGAIKLKSTMNPFTTSFQESLRKLCQRFRVERLYLFGSAAAGRFQPERSDLDFLVVLQEQPPGEYADNYLGLAHALEQLFERRVDLVTERSIRNPYFRQTVLADRQLLYDHRDKKAAA